MLKPESLDSSVGRMPGAAVSQARLKAAPVLGAAWNESLGMEEAQESLVGWKSIILPEGF